MIRPIVITRRAARQIEVARAWWYKHRHKAIFALDDEIEEAIAKIADTPHMAPVARDIRMKGVRRMLLQTTQYHVYYREKFDAIEVVAFWHASRGTPPRI
ncbi:MAG TPA: type II toxin-antitoxin system RelE/ParE family toxin [Thermoanaerobaculia bacterium]|nr:type II toxin-antitoxin system RelE/ParE family toxin [Thermoanaerobaculia bacterium]